MKVKEKIFEVVDEKERRIDLEKEKRIPALINGEDKGVELKDLFIRHSLDGNEILGYSLLQYFKIKDGALVDLEGNSVMLVTDKNVPLKFKSIDVKFVPLDAIEVPLTYIEAFSYSLIGIQKPEIIFSDLSNSDKKTIVQNREQKEQEKIIADTEQLRIANEASESKRLAEEAEAKQKLESDLKKSIDPSFVYEKRDYLKIKELFEGLGGKEYVQEPYHLFYIAPTEEDPTPKDPTVLIKRGEDWFEEDSDGEITNEDDKTVQYEFSDGEERKVIVMDVTNGLINLNTDIKAEQIEEPSKG